MIKAAGTRNGRPLIILGLSHENLARLVADEPIVFDADNLGFEGSILIVAGKTEDEIASTLRQGAPTPDAGFGRSTES